MRTLAVVALPNGVSVYVGRLDSVGAVLRYPWPRLHVMGVWRERPLAGVFPSDTNRALDGGATPGGPWRFLVREWTRLRRSSRLLRAVSVALLFSVLAVR